ncbi:DNA phosphorothioation-dependent restriction protein DptG, partial [Paenibacillus campinasensis]
LLFLTKIMIKDETKIRLKKLFEEFGLRGIIFDRDTQTAIIEYFEKLNLLEKKSDSGDAIYVKAFL